MCRTTSNDPADLKDDLDLYYRNSHIFVKVRLRCSYISNDIGNLSDQTIHPHCWLMFVLCITETFKLRTLSYLCEKTPKFTAHSYLKWLKSEGSESG